MKFKLRSKDQVVRAAYFRGIVLNSFIFLENDISACLAEFFCGNNNSYWTFINVIADRMTFEAKRSSLRYLLEDLERKAGFVKTKGNCYKCRDLINELRLLNDQRNYFAHYQNVGMDGKEHYAILLQDCRDDWTEHSYMEEDISKLIARIGKASVSVKNIYMEQRAISKANEEVDE